LYFSCKNYHEKLWSCFTKVVLFFTSNPTKLGLHFSDFSMMFYEFYKIQQNGNTIEETDLRGGPWKFPCSQTYALGLQHSPWKE
jgi:hypothetical protein